MNILKIVDYYVKYKHECYYAASNIETIERESITDLDKDITEFLETECEEIKSDLVSKILKHTKINKLKIGSKKFNIVIAISYTDVNKCNPDFTYAFIKHKNITHEEYFNKFARSVKYYVNYYKKYKTVERYECYGELNNLAPFVCEYEHRCELEDENTHIYNIGDIVTLKHEKCGVKEGVITCIITEKDLPCCLRLYEITDKNGNCTWSDKEVAHTEIENLIGHDIKLAYEYAKNANGVYVQEYLDTLEQMVQEEELNNK